MTGLKSASGLAAAVVAVMVIIRWWPFAGNDRPAPDAAAPTASVPVGAKQ
jgi:hypothetical protein